MPNYYWLMCPVCYCRVTTLSKEAWCLHCYKQMAVFTTPQDSPMSDALNASESAITQSTDPEQRPKGKFPRGYWYELMTANKPRKKRR